VSGATDTITEDELRSGVRELCDRFPDEYWRRIDREEAYPQEFVSALTEAGWLAALIPAEYGGAGLGISQASVIMEEINRSGANGGACHAQMYIMGTLLRHGSDEQKQEWLPPIASGELRLQAFGVTEPDAGLDTTRLKTRAVRDGNRYIVHGRKMWTTTAQTAQKIVLLARTTSIEQCARPTEGLSLFYTDLNRNYVEVQRIRKMGRAAVDSNAVFIDGLPIPVEDRIGEEGKGFRYILDSLNPERIINAAETVGIGRRALAKATAYAKERIVFGRPIGQNQAIQHPLAESWAELLAAELLVLRAAQLYDSGQPCGAEANAAKYFGADAAFRACDRAVRTHGGMGYASEFHVERYFRESVATRLAPVSRELILCYLAERVLGLPKSY